MKKFKLLSLLTAASISVSCLAGMAIGANAEELLTPAPNEVTDLYKVSSGNSYTAGNTLYDGAFTLKVTNNISTTSHTNEAGFTAGIAFRTQLGGDISSHVSDIVSHFANSGTNNEQQVTSIIFTPKYDGKAGIYLTGISYSSGERALKIWDNTNNSDVSITLKQTDGAMPATFDVVANHEYIVYGRKWTSTMLGAELKYTSTGPVETPDPNATPEPTEEPTPTPKPTAKPANKVEGVADGSAEKLKAAETTKTYDLRKPAAEKNADDFEWGIQGTVYEKENLFFDNEILAAGTSGPSYYSSKKSVDLDGTENKDGIRLKTNQDVIGIKLAPGATVETKVKGGGDGARNATISTIATEAKGDLAKSGDLLNYAVENISYKNESDQEKVVYLSATGDSFISQIKVTVPVKKKTTVSTNGGDAAAAYETGSVTLGDGSPKKFQWIIKNNEGKSGTIDAKLGTVTTGNVVFGLIITGAEEKLNTIQTVELVSVD